MMKKGGQAMREAVCEMCRAAWQLEEVPKEWMQGVIVPLYKDGDNRDPLNYRGITRSVVFALKMCLRQHPTSRLRSS